MSEEGPGLVGERTVHGKVLELSIGMGKKAGIQLSQDGSRVHGLGVAECSKQGQPRDKLLSLRSVWDVRRCEGQEEWDKIAVMPLSKRWA